MDHREGFAYLVSAVHMKPITVRKFICEILTALRSMSLLADPSWFSWDWRRRVAMYLQLAVAAILANQVTPRRRVERCQSAK